MTRVERIENEIQRMSPQEISSLRTWFVRFDAASWDRQFEEDAKAGKLDALASQSLRYHQAGSSAKE